MSYMTDISEMLAKQLMKSVTLQRHQLAGQAANLEFCSNEVQHCLDVIDGYKSRFTRMRAAQMAYAADHQTSEFRLDPDDTCCFPGKASPPRRIDYRELEAAGESLGMRCVDFSFAVGRSP
jgi:hypothetical protein